MLWDPCLQELSTGAHPEPDESSPYHLTLSKIHYLRPILILSTHLRRGLRNCLFLSTFPTKILYAILFFLMCATCRAHHIFLDLMILIIFDEVYKLWSSSLCCLPNLLFPHPSSVLHTLFSNILSVCSSLNNRDQDLHRYKTISKINHTGKEPSNFQRKK
jgi:hypothetical protein